PAVASTATRSPSFNRHVTPWTLAMAGRPYSRAMIAPWDSVPPISTTSPAASPMSGAIPGSITDATRISPLFTFFISFGGNKGRCPSGVGPARQCSLERRSHDRTLAVPGFGETGAYPSPARAGPARGHSRWRDTLRLEEIAEDGRSAPAGQDE